MTDEEVDELFARLTNAYDKFSRQLKQSTLLRRDSEDSEEGE